MVYGALLLALASGRVLSGAAVMAAFALGTMPSLIAIGLATRSTAQRPRRGLRVLAGLAIATVGAYGLFKLGAHFAAFTGLCEIPPALLHY